LKILAVWLTTAEKLNELAAIVARRFADFAVFCLAKCRRPARADLRCGSALLATSQFFAAKIKVRNHADATKPAIFILLVDGRAVMSGFLKVKQNQFDGWKNSIEYKLHMLERKWNRYFWPEKLRSHG
jgi:hypothetical protein